MDTEPSMIQGRIGETNRAFIRPTHLYFEPSTADMGPFGFLRESSDGVLVVIDTNHARFTSSGNCLASIVEVRFIISTHNS